MSKDEAIAIALAFWVKDEWQYVYTDEAIAVKVADALSVLTGVMWVHKPVTSRKIQRMEHSAFGVEPIQQVDWVKL